jgi:hypothetical protein
MDASDVCIQSRGCGVKKNIYLEGFAMRSPIALVLAISLQPWPWVMPGLPLRFDP